MAKLQVILGSIIIGIGLWGCSNISKKVPPSMTKVTLQICGEEMVRNKLEEACLSNTAIYWGKVSQKDIKLVEMEQKKHGKLEYYFVTVSAAGCVADWANPRPKITDLVAIKSMYSQQISGKSPQIKLLNLVEVEEKDRQLLIEETEEKLAFSTV